MLGKRRSSVFPAPIRPILTATSHADASSIRRRVEGKGISIQTWAIVPKIIEVDSLLQADMTRHEVVREVHPEVSFFFLNGNRPLGASKKTPDGYRQREALLQQWCGQATVNARAMRAELKCQMDDLLDALVVLWTAERIAAGTAMSIPATPPVDACGLRMEMLA